MLFKEHNQRPILRQGTPQVKIQQVRILCLIVKTIQAQALNGDDLAL